MFIKLVKAIFFTLLVRIPNCRLWDWMLPCFSFTVERFKRNNGKREFLPIDQKFK